LRWREFCEFCGKKLLTAKDAKNCRKGRKGKAEGLRRDWKPRRFQSGNGAYFLVVAAFFLLPKPVSTEAPMLASICLATSA
jgi:hypothetical protein